MTTERLYREDPYLTAFEARVVARREHAGRPAVVLDRTAFYPESGGQPWDLGMLSDVPVVAVVDEGGDVLHVLGGALETEAVTGRVDAARRRDHREQHHGQHLLSRAFEDVARARTTSFHLGADEVSIDLDRDVSDADVDAAEERTNEIVAAARPVAVRIVTRSEAAALGVKTPPEEAGDAIRLVEAEGFDLQPCGGTHPRSTAEVGVVVVLGHERYKGGARVRFVCGLRAIRAVRNRSQVLDRLSSVLSAPLDGLVGSAERLVAARSAAEKRVRDFVLQSLDAEAARLAAAASDAIVVASYDGWDPEALRGLAQRLTGLRPGAAFLGSRAADKAYVAFAQSEGFGLDVAALLKDAVASLGGRGGGKGNLAQGGGDKPEALDEALANAARSARERAAR